MKLTTTKIFIFSMILLLMSFGATAYALVSLNQQGDKLIADLRSLKDHYFMKTEYQKLQAELDQTSNERERLASLVLEGETGAVEFLSLVDWLAKDLNLSLTTRQLSEEVTPEEKFDELFIEFGVSGDSRAAMKFIQLLELLPYHSQVTSLNVVRKYSSATQSETIEAIVGLRVTVKEN